MRTKKTASIDWPQVNTRAWVRTIDYAGQLATRVEDHSNNNIVIANPSFPDGSLSREPERKQEVFLGWVDGKSLTEVPLEVLNTSGDKLRLWHCAAIGPAKTVQRRSFVRVPALFEVRMFLNGTQAATEATVLDISEGGLRLQLDRWTALPETPTFDLELPLPSGKMILTSEIAWWGDLSQDRFRQVGVRFLGLSEKQGDLIRRHVFTLEIENRKRANDS